MVGGMACGSAGSLAGVSGRLIVGILMLVFGGAFLDMSESLLKALGHIVKFPMWRLSITRYNGVEHGNQLLSIQFDLEILLLDDAAHFS